MGRINHLVLILFAGVTLMRSPAAATLTCDGDLNGDAAVTVDEIVRAVGSALNGCGLSSGFWNIAGSVSIPGNIRGIEFAPSGELAYVGTGTAVIEIDVAMLKPTRSLFTGGSNVFTTLSAIDSNGELALLYSFDGTAIFKLSDGSEIGRFGGGSSGESTFANGKVYAPSFNGRGIFFRSISGSASGLITPFPNSQMLAGPHLTTSTLDGTRVLFDDEFNDAVHVIDTATDTVISSISVGFDPTGIFAIDSSTAVVFVDGAVEIVDLSNPTSVPMLRPVPILQPIREGGFSNLPPRIEASPDRTEAVVVKPSLVDEGSTSLYRPRIAIVDAFNGSTRSEEVLVEIPPAPDFFYSVAVSPDGEEVLLAFGTTIYRLIPQEPLP